MKYLSISSIITLELLDRCLHSQLYYEEDNICKLYEREGHVKSCRQKLMRIGTP